MDKGIVTVLSGMVVMLPALAEVGGAGLFFVSGIAVIGMTYYVEKVFSPAPSSAGRN